MTVVAGFALVLAYFLYVPARFAWATGLVFLQVIPAVLLGAWASLQEQKRQGTPISRGVVLWNIGVFMFVSLGVWVMLLSLLFIFVFHP